MNGFFARFHALLARPLVPWSRLLIVLLVVPLGLALTQPLWRIRMVAPQYPSGLTLDIYPYTIHGGNEGRDLPEINTLNHYIGMKKLDRGDFTDLDWIPFAIGALVLLTLRLAAVGDVRALLDLTVLTAYFTLFSAGRFVFKLWYYGHNLDPHAPIHMDPFMPALLGTRQVGNFATVSYPLLGSYLLALFATSVLLLSLWHLRVLAPRFRGANEPGAPA
jgi:copper chaperone NosL